MAEEQNHAELALAGVAASAQSTAYTTEAFLFGIDAFLSGLGTTAAGSENGAFTPS